MHLSPSLNTLNNLANCSLFIPLLFSLALSFGVETIGVRVRYPQLSVFEHYHRRIEVNRIESLLHINDLEHESFRVIDFPLQPHEDRVSLFKTIDDMSNIYHI